MIRSFALYDRVLTQSEIEAVVDAMQGSTMNSKSYNIVVNPQGFAIMETTIFWRVDADGEHHVVNMTIRRLETLLIDAGNTYEGAEDRLRGWYRAAAISMKA